jgi:hypothetical protein
MKGWPLVDTESRCHGDSFNHWSKRADNKLSLLDLYQRNLKDDPEGSSTRVVAFYGTNFRHAVEFSRSGRTPSRPFRDDPGQPETRYSGRKVQVKRPVRPASHLVAAHVRPTCSRPRRVALGGCSTGSPRYPGDPPCGGSPCGPLWLRPSNKENISQLPGRESNPLGKASGLPCLLACDPLGRYVGHVTRRVWGL